MMNARYFSFALLLAASSAVTAQGTVFVAPSKSGDGKSWETATGDLQAALKSAKPGTVIWVAEGIYHPTAGRDRSASFEVKEGVQLIGGFAGNEASLTDRQPELHPTVLSGNIGRDAREDNSYNVVSMENASPATLLDGFIITNGHADGNGQSGDRARSGGGLFIKATSSASPTVKNCTFIDNSAKDGGAIYVQARNGAQAAPVIKNCGFEANSADLDGGAINLDGRAKGSNRPVITGCTFSGNKGNYGGAIFCYGLGGESLPKLINCRMTENSAYVKGGAVFQMTTDAAGQVDLEKVVFSNNTALDHDTDDFTQYSVATNEFASKN